MEFQLLSRPELQIGREQLIDVGLLFEDDDDPDEGEPSQPGHQPAVKVEALEDLADHQHQVGPEIVARADPEKLGNILIVVGILYVVGPVQPGRQHEKHNGVDVGIVERGEVEDELADDFVDDEDHLGCRVLPGLQLVCRHTGLEQSEGHDRRDEHEYRREQQGDYRVEQMPPLETLNRSEAAHDLHTGVVL